MRGRAASPRAVVERSRLRFGERDQLADRIRGHRRVHREDERGRGEQRHRGEVAHHVVGNLVHARIDRMRSRREEQRVAVGRRLRDRLGRDRSAAAAALVDDHRLAPDLGDLLPDHPREGIRPGTDDKADRFRGIVLRRGVSRGDRRERQPRCELHCAPRRPQFFARRSSPPAVVT